MSKVYLVYCKFPETYSFSGWAHELEEICATKEIAESYIRRKGYVPGVRNEKEFVTYSIEEHNVIEESDVLSE